MNILAIAASNSKNSINMKLLKSILNPVPEYKCRYINLNEIVAPIFSVDQEKRGIPDSILNLYREISESDGVMVSFAEHNGNYSAAYKNVYDWLSRIDRKVFQGKPCLFLSASIGLGGKKVLDLAVESSEQSGADLRYSKTINKFFEVFDEQNNKLTDEDLRIELENAARYLIKEDLVA